MYITISAYHQKMLSPRVTLLLESITNRLHRFHLLPFLIKKCDNGKLVADCPAENFAKRYPFQIRYLWAIAPISYQLYFCFQIQHIIADKRGDQSHRFASGGWVLIFWIGYSWTLSVLVNFWIFEKDVANFITKFLAIDKTIGVSTGTSTRSKIEWDFIACIFYKWLGIIFNGMLVGIHVFNPNYMQYSTSYLTYKENRALFVSLTVIDAVTIAVGVVMMLYELALQSFYLLSTSQCLVSLRKCNLPFKEKVRLYTYLQLANRLHEGCFRMRIPHLTFTLSLCAIVGYIGMIHFHSTFGLFDLGGMFCFAMGGSVIMMGILHCFGYIVSGCKKLIRSLKEHGDKKNKVERRVIKVLHTFGIRDGPIRIMTYDGMYHMAGGTINMLVTILVLLGHT